MKQLLRPGRIIFAIGFFALGILCFIYKDFIVGRPPVWPQGFTGSATLGYVSGALLIVAAITILLSRRGGPAALMIAALILLLSLSRHLPHFMNDWANAYKTMALFGGALIIAASFLKEYNPDVNKNTINALVMIGSVLLTAFFLMGGYAHFNYAAVVDTLIPDYIPFHRFWTYFCGVCLFAGGVGLLIPATRKWAALLSGIMVAGWFVLLHIPRFIADTSNTSDRLGLCESFTFVGIFFVLAAMLAEKE